MPRKRVDQIRVWASAAVLGWVALVIVSPANGNAAGGNAAGGNAAGGNAAGGNAAGGNAAGGNAASSTAAAKGAAALPAGAVEANSSRLPLQSAGLLDGAPCAQDAECLSGICSSLFTDADDDGFGAGSPLRSCGGAPPAGFALRGDDCCDLASVVFPGQSQQFTDPVPPQCVGIPPFDYNCDGVDDVQLLGNGAPCQQNAQCAAGICNAFFTDADDDGFGAGSPLRLCGGSPPAGFALRGDDCCDLASVVFPGQNQLFTDPVPPQCVGIPPFDYNCDGVDD